MKPSGNNKSIVAAILIAAILISGSLAFLGIRFSSGNIDEALLDKKIEEGIEAYIAKQRQAALKVQQEKQQQESANIKNVRKVTPTRDHILGNQNADVSLIEYSDFECPFCKKFHQTPGKLLERFGNKVNWVYRHFPLNFHNPAAQMEAEAAECVASLGGNKRFWTYADKIYRETASNGKGVAGNGIIDYAVELGIQEQAFTACLEQNKYRSRVAEDYDEGINIGISGTPGVVLLNNKTGEVRYKAGAYPLDVYVKIIEELL